MQFLFHHILVVRVLALSIDRNSNQQNDIIIGIDASKIKISLLVCTQVLLEEIEWVGFLGGLATPKPNQRDFHDKFCLHTLSRNDGRVGLMVWEVIYQIKLGIIGIS
jgi:hypothetical protein